MKKIRLFILTFTSFIFFSCAQLNLKNPVGSVSVSLPGESTRFYVPEDSTVDDYKEVKYKVSLCSSIGDILIEKTATPGSSVEFPELEEGSYIIKAYCHGSVGEDSECLAAGYKTVQVKGGEDTKEEVPLFYNRLSNVDAEKSLIKYSGSVLFESKDKLNEYMEKNFYASLSAEIVFINGWASIESYNSSEKNFIVEEPVKQDSSDEKGIDKYSVTVSWRKKINSVIYLSVAQESEPVIEPIKDQTIDKNKSEIICSHEENFTSESDWNEFKSNLKNYFKINLVYENGEEEIIEAKDTDTFIFSTPIKKESTENKIKYEIIAMWANTKGSINKTFAFYVTSEQNSKAGLSIDNPCTTGSQLEQAIANVNENGRIYLAGTGGVLELTGTFTITKNCTIYSTVNGLQVKRANNDTYFYISSEVMIDASTNKITFTDDESITTVSTGNGFFYGPGTLKAYSVAFSGIKGNTVQVSSAVLSSCSFSDISSNYGAVYIESGKSAQIGSCTFSRNTSVQSGSYGDVYFVKDGSSTLTLDESVVSDIGIYVDNSKSADPNINVDGLSISSGKKLRVKLDFFPEGTSALIYLFTNAVESIRQNITFAVKGSDEEYELNDCSDFGDDDVYYSMYDPNDKIFSVHIN